MKATEVRVTDDALAMELADGRSISAPLVWFPRLLHGSPAERNNPRLIGGGEGVHWPELDEDISVEGVLAGRPSGESARSFQKWLESRQRGSHPELSEGLVGFVGAGAAYGMRSFLPGATSFLVSETLDGNVSTFPLRQTGYRQICSHYSRTT
jgi:hypothetical protein